MIAHNSSNQRPKKHSKEEKTQREKENSKTKVKMISFPNLIFDMFKFGHFSSFSHFINFILGIFVIFLEATNVFFLGQLDCTGIWADIF
jgi:hypothetical protein